MTGHWLVVVSGHRARVEGRSRSIPGWYELEWSQVERARRLYPPLAEPKVTIDAVDSVEDNLARVLHHLRPDG